MHLTSLVGRRHCFIGMSAQIKDVGVVLAHGSQAATWKGKTLTAIASKLAAEGVAV